MSHARLMHDFPSEGENRAIEAIAIAPQRSESARGSSAAGSPSPRHEPQEGEAQDYDNDDSDTGNNRPGTKSSRPRKPHLQGRFSGRLETKQDEKKLAEECKLLGPLLGGTGKRGERSRLTLAKIVRGIASGDVRKYCLGRERKLQELTAQVDQLKAQLKSGGMAAPILLKEESIPAYVTSTPLASSTVLPVGIGLNTTPKSDFPLPEAASASPLQVSVSLDEPSGLDSVAVSMGASAPPASTAQASEAQVLVNGAVQLQAQAQNFQAHAEQLAQQSKVAHSGSESLQVAVQAQSFQAKAQSLEKAAQAQNLQAQAVVHAQAQAQAQAQAHHLVAQAHDHAQAYAHAAAKADHLKKVSSTGPVEIYEAHDGVAAEAQHLEHEAHSHAQAQTELTVKAHNLAAKAQAHAHAQAQAQAQAQQAAVEAHQLDAAAQQLQAEAHAVHNPLPAISSAPDKISMVPVEHMLGTQAGSGRGDRTGFVGLDLHADSAGGGSLTSNLALEVSQGPIVSLTNTHAMGNQVELQS